MFRKLKSMKVLLSATIIALIVAGFTKPSSAYLSNNIGISLAIQSNFKYEKTIDLTNGDRSKLPEADFNFNMETIRDDEYMIGSKYKSATGRNAFTIVKGKLPENKESMLFSTVKFRATDRYDEKLTELLDNYRSGEAILNHILKYDWGEMRSSEHIQTAFSRMPNEDEKAYFNTYANNGWPEDTILWRCFHENAEGSFGEGCQVVNVYPFDEFNYARTFDLYANPAVTYVAYSFRRPILSHVEKGSDGLYNSVSKPLLTTDEYFVLQDELASANTEDGGKVYRFILKEEDNPDDEYKANNEVKIVDLLSKDLGGGIMIFNSVEEADAFYKEAGRYKDREDGNNWEGSYFTSMVPKAEFTNSIDKEETEKPPVNKPNEPVSTEPSKNLTPNTPSMNNLPNKGNSQFNVQTRFNRPKTNDNSMSGIYLGFAAISLLAIAGTSRIKVKKNK